jgi:cold shock protein
MIGIGTVAWFDLTKLFGFLAIKGSGDASARVSVLKKVGYVRIPRGTTMRVRIDEKWGKRQVAEIFEIDTTTAQDGEKAPVLRKRRN